MADRLVIAYGDYWGHWVNAASFFGNVILIASLTTSCRPHGSGGRCNPAAGYVLFGAVAGIMVYISLDELLPTSRACGKEHDSLFGLLAGMVVMALSLLCDGRTRTTIYWLL